MHKMATKQKKLLFIILFVYSSLAIPDSYTAAPLITAAPAFRRNAIDKRAADQTCGYVNGDPSKTYHDLCY